MDELADVESLTRCSQCQQNFNSTDHCPKFLACKHYFCLKCIKKLMISAEELTCVLCRKKLILGEEGVEGLETHKAIISLAHHLTTLAFADVDTDDKRKNPIGCTSHGLSWTLWCYTCQKPLCRICYDLIEHSGHQITSESIAKELFHTEVQTELAEISKLCKDIHNLSDYQKKFQIRVLEACIMLKTKIENDTSLWVGDADRKNDKDLLLRAQLEMSSMKTSGEIYDALLNLVGRKKRLQMRYLELAHQTKIEEAISTAGVLLDLPTVASMQNSDWVTAGLPSPLLAYQAVNQPLLLLANYCILQVYKQIPLLGITAPIAMSPIANPRYYFSMKVNDEPVGRFIIETRPDLAPKMAHNFDALSTAESGPSYRNCTVFQCWDGESIITGDYEWNNGRGGRAVYEEGAFLPDDSHLAPTRGAVGMRRWQKRHDNLGMVGSQFRIILQDMRGFTGIFGFVVEGIEIVENIARFGDKTGKPTKNIVINDCGLV